MRARVGHDGRAGAYARDVQTVCFFQNALKFETRYSTLDA